MSEFSFDLQRFDEEEKNISKLDDLASYAKDSENNDLGYYKLTSGTYNITGSVALDKPIVIPTGQTVIINLGATLNANTSTFNGGTIKSLIQIQGNGNLTINNGTVSSARTLGTKNKALVDKMESTISIVDSTDADGQRAILTIGTNGTKYPTINGMVYGIKADTAAEITINGSNNFSNQLQVNSVDIGKDLIYQNGGTLTISGAQYLTGTTSIINLKNGELKFTGTGTFRGKKYFVAAGSSVYSNAAIIFEDSSATINTTATIGSTSDTTALLVKGTENKTITINGGTFAGASNSIDNQSTNATVKITKGSFNQALTGTGKYEISGGSFSTDVSEYVSEEMKQCSLTVNGKTTFYSAETIEEAKTNALNNAVAVVYDTDGETVLKYYTSLNSAGIYAKDDETITLLKDDTSTASYISTSWTLDLNGHTWTPDFGSLSIKDGVTFTLKDSASGGKIVSSTAVNASVNKYGLVYVEAGGTFKFESGSIESNAVGVYVLEGGIVNMNGGTVKTTSETYTVTTTSGGYGSDLELTYNPETGEWASFGGGDSSSSTTIELPSRAVLSSGNFTLNGGTIGTENDNKSSIGVNNIGGTFDMKGGNVYGTYAGVYSSDSGKFTMEEGTISGTNGVITTGAATEFTMNGGSITSTGTDTSSHGVSVSKGAVFNFKDGTITASSSGVGVYGRVKNSEDDAEPAYKNSTFNMTGGSITAEKFGVVTNGRDDDDNQGTEIKISGGSVTSNGAPGIYNPAYESSVTISDIAQIKGTTGIEIRNGKLNVTGGTIEGTGSSYSSSSNTSGSTSSGAGISVSPYGNRTIEVNIGQDASSNDARQEIAINGANALALGNKDEIVANSIKVTINDGTFSSTDEYSTQESSGNSIYDNDKVANIQINGGIFTDSVKQTEEISIGTETTTENANIVVNGGAFAESIDNVTSSDTDTGDNTQVVTINNKKFYLPKNTTSTPTNLGVAKIGDTYYTTLEEAFSAANGTDTIILIANTTITSTINVSTTATLDLAGFTVTYSGTTDSAITVTNNGNLTVTDSSTDKTGAITATSTTAITNNGELTISSGTISGGSCGIANGGTLTVSDGTISCSCGIANYSNGTLKINGGTISDTSDTLDENNGYGCGIKNESGTLEITNGNVSGSFYGVYNVTSDTDDDNFNVKISGGTVSGGCVNDDGEFEGAGIYMTTGSLEVSGGTIVANKGDSTEDEDSDLIPVAINVKDETVATISSGTINGYLAADGDVLTSGEFYTITGGTFTEEKYVPFDYVYKKATEGTGYVIADAITIGDNSYYSLREAIDAANNSDGEVTIKLTGNVNINETLEITGKVVLDLNGYTITDTSGSYAIQIDSGELTIQDTSDDKKGTIKSIDASACITNIGTLTIKSGTIEAIGDNGSNVAIEDGGGENLILEGGTIKASGGSSTGINGGNITIAENADVKVIVDSSDDGGGVGIESPGSLTIADGAQFKINVSGDNSTGIKNENPNSDLEIKDGVEIEVDGENSTAVSNGGNANLTISGGTITAKGTGSKALVNGSSSTTNITGGTITAEGSEDEENSSTAINNEGLVNIINGTINGTITDNADEDESDAGTTGVKYVGGTLNNPGEDFDQEKCVASVTIATTKTDAETGEEVTTTTTQYYKTFESAVAAVNLNDNKTKTIALLADVTIPSTDEEDENGNITFSQDVTLNLNGNNITYSGSSSAITIARNTLTVEGSGTITASSGNGIKVTNGGELVLNNGSNITATNGTAIDVESGSVKIGDSESTTTTPTISGSVVLKFAGTDDKSHVTLNSGTLKGTTTAIINTNTNVMIDLSKVTVDGALGTGNKTPSEWTTTNAPKPFSGSAAIAAVTISTTTTDTETGETTTTNTTTYYSKLSDAINAANTNTTDATDATITVTLLDDVTLDSTITISKGITFDLGGNTVTYNSTNLAPAFIVGENNSTAINVTMTNGKINYTTSESNTDDSPAIKVNNNATLNLGNTTDTSSATFEIDSSNKYALAVFINGGTLNVNNNATLTSKDYFTIIYQYSGNVKSACTINGGTVTSHATGGYGTIYMAGSNSSFEMKAGTVSYDGSAFCTICTDSLKSGTFTMSGGTIKNTYNATNAGAVEMYQMSSASITGGKIISNSGIAILDYANTSISGNAVVYGGYAGIATHHAGNMTSTITVADKATVSGGTTGILSRDNSNFTISGGTVQGGTGITFNKGVLNVSGGIVQSGTVALDDSGNVTFTDSAEGNSILNNTTDKKVSINGGTFGGKFATGSSLDGVSEGFTITNAPTTIRFKNESDAPAGYAVVKESSTNLYQLTPVAKIGENTYYSLEDAITAVTDSTETTISLIKTISPDKAIEIPSGKKITLDLNGYNITSTADNAIKVVGELNIKYSGTDLATANSITGNILLSGASAKFTLTKGTITGDLFLDSAAANGNVMSNISIAGGSFSKNSDITAANNNRLLAYTTSTEATTYNVGVEGWKKTSDSDTTWQHLGYNGTGADSTKKIGVYDLTLSNVANVDADTSVAIDSNNSVVGLGKDITIVENTIPTATFNSTTYSVAIVTNTANDTASIKTFKDNLKITETLYGSTVTKVTASDNNYSVDITGNNTVTSIVGGTKDDTLTAGNANATLDGGTGDDSLYGGKLLIGGEGEDTLQTSETDATLDGGTGNDSLSGGISLVGGEGKDTLTTTLTDATLDGGTGNDNLSGGKSLVGGEGNDTLTTTLTDATLDGGAGNDSIVGGKSLVGGAGSDTLQASASGSTLDGGEGNDNLIGDSGADLFVMSAGTDIINNFSADDSVELLSDTTLTSDDSGNVILTSGENVTTISKVDTQEFIACITTTQDSKITAKFYTDLQTALNAGGNIILLKDITPTDTLTITQTVTLDLNGHSITSSVDNAINVSGGTFTLKDSGKTNGAITTSNNANAINISGGTVIINTNNVDADIPNITGNILLSGANANLTLTAGIIKGDLFLTSEAANGGAVKNVNFGNDVTSDYKPFTENDAIKTGANFLAYQKTSTATNYNVGVAGWKQEETTTWNHIIAKDNNLGEIDASLSNVASIASDTTIVGKDTTNSVVGLSADISINSGQIPTASIGAETGYKVAIITSPANGTASVKTFENDVKITSDLYGSTVIKVTAAGNNHKIHIEGNNAITSIVGGDGNDTLTTSNASATLEGGVGNDSLVGGKSLVGGEGDDTLQASLTGATLDGGAGVDSLIGGTGADLFVATVGNDIINNYNNNDTIKFADTPTAVTFGNGDDSTNVIFNVGSDSITVEGKKGVFLTTTDGTNQTVGAYYENASISGATAASKKILVLGADFSGTATASDYTIDGANVTTADATAATNAITFDGFTSISGYKTVDKIVGTPEDANTSGNDLVVTSSGGTVTIAGAATSTVNLTANDTNYTASKGVITNVDSKLVSLTGNYDTGTAYTVADSIKTVTAAKIVSTNAKVTIDGSATDGVNITGSSGADSLKGSAKADELKGGSGADTFVMSEGSDTITDFSATEDSVELLNADVKFSSDDSGNIKLTSGNNVTTINKVDSQEFIACITTTQDSKTTAKFYTTLQDALNAGGNVVLLKDVTDLNTALNIATNNTVTLNLNGYKITYSATDSTAISISGSLTLTDGTDAKGSITGNILLNNSNAELTLNADTIEGDLLLTAAATSGALNNVKFGDSVAADYKPFSKNSDITKDNLTNLLAYQKTSGAENYNVGVAGWKQEGDTTTWSHIVAKTGNNKLGEVDAILGNVASIASDTTIVGKDTTNSVVGLSADISLTSAGTAPTASIKANSTDTSLTAGYNVAIIDTTNSDTASVKTFNENLKITSALYGNTVTKVTAAGNSYGVNITGNATVTEIIGTDKADTLTTTNENATLNGGADNDSLVGGKSLVGGEGDDTLTSINDNAKLNGGTGNDLFVLTLGTATIIDYNNVEGDNDTIQLGCVHTKESIIMAKRIKPAKTISSLS